MFSLKNLTVEHLWWFGILLWVILALAWRPAPRPLLLDAPSTNPEPLGFHIFYELVRQETPGVVRVLQSSKGLEKKIGVLVLLNPTEPVPKEHRKQMLDWVYDTGGTLLVGHPVFGEDGEPVTQFLDSAAGPICAVVSLESFEVTPLLTEEPPDSGAQDPKTNAAGNGSPSVEQITHGIALDDCEGEALLLNPSGRPIAVKQKWGSGKLIQLSDATLLENDALGRKHTHAFASSLLEEAGHSKFWAFDESYENIRPEPKYVELIGASRYRPIFLQLVLIGLFLYWRFSGRFGRVHGPLHTEDVREVTTQARDLGDFYRRAKKNLWALERSRDYLQIVTQEKGIEPGAKEAAYQLIDHATKILSGARNNSVKHTSLIRKIAKCQRALTHNTRKHGK